MVPRVFEDVREGLLEKRHRIREWLSTTPASKKELRLGPAAQEAVQAHLEVLDTALGQTADGTLGVCTVCHEYVGTELLQMDYTCCVCLDHLSPAEMRRLEYELELSQVVQRALLPQAVPEVPGLEIAAFSRPAEILGGDFFDFLHFGDGRHGLAIADVAGKGVSASLLMASVQTALRTLVPSSTSPADVLERVNRLFLHNIHFTTFVTLFLGFFDPSQRRLTYSNAGHNPPLILRQAGSSADGIDWLQPTGAAIGLIEEAQFRVETVTLWPGDLVLLYTDGITEAVNAQDEQFGEERLAALVRGARSSSPRDLVAALRGTLEEFTRGRPMADDTTVIACRVAG